VNRLAVDLSAWLIDHHDDQVRFGVTFVAEASRQRLAVLDRLGIQSKLIRSRMGTPSFMSK
jgi:hypothetical protein